ncbi:uncharacterized protein LOC130449876 [Diorhabda sublineata]|uniref:uncharacterized protein LOC130449876 n=1 Tax=Diorhabda sublineata TaxID=1163346 RepID=UPI0024E07F97|nr:uncharacterized protein LOC130449876 [Diorhabda sublineata]
MTIKFLQHNSGKGKRATDQLLQTCNEQDIDIILIQEPFHDIKPPPNYIITRHNKHSKTCTITKAVYKPITITSMTDENTTTIQIQLQDTTIHIINIYDEPGGNRNKRLDRHRRKIEEIKNPFILAGDFNAKNTGWGGDINDDRGEDILDWITSRTYFINNTHDSPPTFISNRGKSWVDLTITKEITLTDWIVHNEETLSDHAYITYNIRQNMRYDRQKTNKTKYDFNNTDNEKIKRITDNLDWTLLYDVESTAQKYQNNYVKIMENGLKKEKREKRKKTQIWWTQELTRLRQKTNKKRKQYQQEQNTIERAIKLNIYREQRRIYKKEIKRNKINSLRQFLTDNDPDNPWETAYRILRAGTTTDYSLKTIEKQDGTWTTTREETIMTLHEMYFPPDDIQNDTPLQTEKRKNMTRDFTTPEDPIFTEQEDTFLTFGRPQTWCGYQKRTAPKDQSACYQH